MIPGFSLLCQDLKVQKQRAERTAKNSLQKHLKDARSELEKDSKVKATGKKGDQKAKAKSKAKAKKVFDLELPDDPSERAQILAKAIKDAEEMDGLVAQVVGALKLPEKLTITRLEKDAVSKSQRVKAMQDMLKMAQEKAEKVKGGEDESKKADCGDEECDEDMVYKNQQASLSSFGWKGAVKHFENLGQDKRGCSSSLLVETNIVATTSLTCRVLSSGW